MGPSEIEHLYYYDSTGAEGRQPERSTRGGGKVRSMGLHLPHQAAAGIMGTRMRKAG